MVYGFMWLQEHVQKKHVFKRDWIASSKYDNHADLNNQHDGRDLYDHLMSTRILTMNKIFT